MTVKSDNGVLKIILSETEIVHYGIDNVLFDERSKEAKTALKKLLKIAILKSETPLFTTQFSIEIYPVFDGGCEVFFIPKPSGIKKRKVAQKRGCQRMVAILMPSGEAVLQICSELFKQGIKLENRLYKLDDGFCLCIAADGFKALVLAEFQKTIVDSPIEVAKVLEYGVEICENAIERIGQTLYGR